MLFIFRAGEKLELRHTLGGHALGVLSVDINAQGNMAASSSLDAHIRLWDIETGKQVEQAGGRAEKTRHLQVTMLAASHIGYRSTTRCQNASRNHFSVQESWHGVKTR